MRYSTLLSRLQNLINDTPSVGTLAKITGLTEKNLYARRSYNREFSEEEVKKIEDWYAIAGLLTGEIIKSPEGQILLDYFPNVFGSCGTGYFVSSEEKEQIQVPVNALFKQLSKGKKYSVINAQGTSMQPYIEPGDKLIIEHLENQPIVDNHVYVFCYDKDLYIKRLYKNIDEIIAKSDNPDPIFKVKSIPKTEWDNLQLIGEIVGLMRDFR